MNGTVSEREQFLEDALLEIRGLCLGNGPPGRRKTIRAINEVVGYAVYGDFEDSKYVAGLKEIRAGADERPIPEELAEARRENGELKDALDEAYYALGTAHELVKGAIHTKTDRFKRLERALKTLGKARDLTAAVQYDPNALPEASDRG